MIVYLNAAKNNRRITRHTSCITYKGHKVKLIPVGTNEWTKNVDKSKLGDTSRLFKRCGDSRDFENKKTYVDGGNNNQSTMDRGERGWYSEIGI